MTEDAPSLGQDAAAEALAWEAPERGSPEGDAPTLRVDGFEGPLDWLLALAQARRIDLTRVSILALVEAFGAELEAALGRRADRPAHDLARWGDWLVMAATLILLRSRLLLPAGAPEARAAASRAEALRRRLIGRAQPRAAADWLEQQPQLGRDMFARGAPEESVVSHVPARTADLTALLRACLVVLRVREQAEAYQPRLPPLWRVSDATVRIGRLLSLRPEGGPLEAFLPKSTGEASERNLRCRAALASTLVAGLELARDGTLTLEQEGTWMPIQVRHGSM